MKGFRLLILVLFCVTDADLLFAVYESNTTHRPATDEKIHSYQNRRSKLDPLSPNLEAQKKEQKAATRREKRNAAARARRANPEVWKKIRAAERARRANPEYRKKLRAAQRARRANPEYRKKLNAERNARNANPEYREKRNAAQRARRAEQKVRLKNGETAEINDLIHYIQERFMSSDDASQVENNPFILDFQQRKAALQNPGFDSDEVEKETLQTLIAACEDNQELDQGLMELVDEMIENGF